MKKVKLATVAATLLVSGGLLAACGADKEADAPAASSTETTEVAASSTEESPEVVSTASISDKADVIAKALSAEGNRLAGAPADITFDSDVTVAGEFHDKNDAAADVYRKLALYSQDENRTVTAEYTITVPKLIVESENFNIVHGTVVGDIDVNANGFVLNAAKVEGNINFATEEQKASAVLDQEGASVTGDVTVGGVATTETSAVDTAVSETAPADAVTETSAVDAVTETSATDAAVTETSAVDAVVETSATDAAE